jgi:hypothetical protein
MTNVEYIRTQNVSHCHTIIDRNAARCAACCHLSHPQDRSQDPVAGANHIVSRKVTNWY